MARRIRVGDRVEISEGSGLDSRKRGVVIAHDRDEHTRYPFTGGRGHLLRSWSTVRLDGGGTTVMPNSRLSHTTERGRGTRAGQSRSRVPTSATWAQRAERAVVVKSTGEFGIVSGISGEHGVMVALKGKVGSVRTPHVSTTQEFLPSELRLLPQRRRR